MHQGHCPGLYISFAVNLLAEFFIVESVISGSA